MSEAPSNTSRWTPGMRSPNPSGRPRGILDARQKLQSAFASDGAAIVRAVVAKALEGDMQAASIALARLAPPIKAQAERVQFELNADGSFTAQAQQILQAVAEGALDPETGRMLIGCIQTVASIKAVEELEQRIINLEEKST